MSFRTVISSYLGSHFTEKERNRWRNFFSSSGNAISSMLLKYQETEVQIQAFTDEDRDTLRICSFEWYQLPICTLQILKSGHYTFILVQL